MRVADLQSDVAAAMVRQRDPARLHLVGGVAPMRRFAIHTRHYAASVGRAIVERFAATVWLVGSAPIIRAATDFVREHPPGGPCMAEYGNAFPSFLESRADEALPPYVGQFATIDWHLGRLAIATDVPPLSRIAYCDPAQVTDACVFLQGGVAHIHVRWSLDELIGFYLSGEAPESYSLRQEEVYLELRGSRGELRIQRLAIGEFIFRRALAHGTCLGDAATAATDADPSFGPADAVMRLLGGGLVTRISVDERQG